MSEDQSNKRRRLFRILNAVFWVAIFAFAVTFTEAWGHWVEMGLEACVPLLLGCYIHLVLRPGGTTGG